MQPANEVIMERWAAGYATQQNGGSLVGMVLEVCREVSFSEGSCACFFSVKCFE